MIRYPLAKLENDIEDLTAELAELRRSKGHDYSGQIDTLANLRDFGWRGVLVRIGDKYHRLKQLTQAGADVHCTDESVDDTMKDLINYANFMLLMRRQERSLYVPEE